MLWDRKYQEFDLVVSSVTTKVKGVEQTHLPGIGDVVWDVVDYSGPLIQAGTRVSLSWISGKDEFLKLCFVLFSQSKNSFFVVTNVIVTKSQRQGKCPEVLVHPY